MNQKTRSNIIYASKILIPIVVVIGLLLGGVSAGIITFGTPGKKANNSGVTATIIIDFGDGSNVSYAITAANTTVYDFLLKTSEIDNIQVKSTYWQQFDSYVIDSITYNGHKYEADSSHYWAYYLNDNYGTVAADKQFVNNNDTIEWKYEKF